MNSRECQIEPAAASIAQVRRRLCIAVGATLAALVAAVLVAVLWLCDGHLIYSLDDPYITLSLAQHIAQGEYGVNAGERASPSSSILYPLLLAAFAWTAWQTWVPLVVNALAAIGTGVALSVAAVRWGIVAAPQHVARGAVLITTLCLSVNTVGLVFTGLEHSLHACNSVVVVLGLARALQENRVPVWLPVAIVLVPLWRFEGLALALLAIAGLAATRHWRAAITSFAGLALTQGAYMATMHALGLPLLPSSVLTKSAVAQHVLDAGSGSIGFIVHAGQNALQRLPVAAWPVALLVAVVALHPLLGVLRGEADRRNRYHQAVFAVVVAGALIAHMMFGGWGWFSRYEAYALALGVAAVLVQWHRPMHDLVAEAPVGLMLLSVTAALCLGASYVGVTLRTPVAAREIFEQQYQMRRFAVSFYHKPVAVNDIGWVSYRNPQYVLDLVGLASEPVRQARVSGEPGKVWINRLVKARGIGLAMIYEEDFTGQIPPDWVRLAVLHTSHHVVAAYDHVTFFATSPAHVHDDLAALCAFQPTLVAGSSLTIVEGLEPCATQQPPRPKT